VGGEGGKRGKGEKRFGRGKGEKENRGGIAAGRKEGGKTAHVDFERGGEGKKKVCFPVAGKGGRIVSRVGRKKIGHIRGEGKKKRGRGRGRSTTLTQRGGRPRGSSSTRRVLGTAARWKKENFASTVGGGKGKERSPRLNFRIWGNVVAW